MQPAHVLSCFIHCHHTPAYVQAHKAASDVSTVRQELAAAQERAEQHKAAAAEAAAEAAAARQAEQRLQQQLAGEQRRGDKVSRDAARSTAPQS